MISFDNTLLIIFINFYLLVVFFVKLNANFALIDLQILLVVYNLFKIIRLKFCPYKILFKVGLTHKDKK